MRLTLRTMLAYMDEILDPEDQQQLQVKIETSDYAGELVHRMRDSMRRLRLSAPQVLGAGLGLDPNSIAEYLDNTLPVEQVTDLERICLESDLHLAEIASCHQVLTMVLGQPADVDPDVRARMYAIPEVAEKCKQPQANPNPRLLRLCGLTTQDIENHTLCEPSGCKECGNTGYRGRKGIFELMVMDNALRELAFQRAPLTKIRETAIAGGMRNLLGDGRLKVLSGQTSLEEIARVAQVEGTIDEGSDEESDAAQLNAAMA